jgi:hypothetical protein
MAVSPIFGNIDAYSGNEFPLLDLHVHSTDQFTIDHIMDIAKKRNVQLGIVEHPAPWAIKNDDDLKSYIGLQPIDLECSKNFSPELLAQIDYILMDPQRVPMANGERLSIWEFDTYLKDLFWESVQVWKYCECILL